MKRKFLSFTLLLTAGILLSSCLGNNEEEPTTYYDSAITGFQIGTLNKYVTTTDKDGKKTITKTAVNCSAYAFYIDQANHLIYNPDSLPAGLDIKHVVTTCYAKNGGVITLKDNKSENVYAYSTQDSIDFSEPRTFIVYNNTGAVKTTYTVKVNMHKQEADHFGWNSTTATNDELGALTGMKLLSCGDNMVLFGLKDGQTKVYATAQSDINGWKALTPNIALDAHAAANVVAAAGRLYLLNGGKLYSSTDGSRWDEVAAAPNLTKLLGASGANIYGLTADNALMRSADGSKWTKETMDDDVALLPSQNINFVTLPLKTNANTNYLVLIGNRDNNYPTDNNAQVWGKVEDNSEEAKAEPWSYYPPTSDNKYKAPRLTNLQIAGYGNDMIALGGKGMGEKNEKAFGGIYRSQDKGITWKVDSVMTLPTAFKSSETDFAMTVDRQNFIWIVCGNSGQIWRGRHDGKGWATEQTKFEK